MVTKLKCGAIATTLSVLTLAASAAHAQSGAAPQVTVDNRPIVFQGQPPIEQAGRVLVPLRGVLEKIGAYVEYHEQAHTVTAYRGDTHILLTIGATEATVGDRKVTLDVPAQVMNGSTLVPLRFVAESLGARVSFDAGTDTVAIVTGHRDQQVSSALRPPRPEDRHPGDDHRDGDRREGDRRDGDRRPDDLNAFHGSFREAHRRGDGLMVLHTANDREIVVANDTPVFYKDQTLHIDDLRPGDVLTIAVDPVTHHGTRIVVGDRQ